MSLCLLTIISPLALEEVIVDWLLEHDNIKGFTSILVRGHGGQEENLSLSEQVTGRSDGVMFDTHIPLEYAHDILGNLKKDFAMSDIHYMIRPVIDAGNIRSYEKN